MKQAFTIETFDLPRGTKIVAITTAVTMGTLCYHVEVRPARKVHPEQDKAEESAARRSAIREAFLDMLSDPNFPA